jgi:hypothetical protein
MLVSCVAALAPRAARRSTRLFLLALVRQSIEPLGDFEQGGRGVDHAGGSSHSTIRVGLCSKLSDRSLGEVGPVFHDIHLSNESHHGVCLAAQQSSKCYTSMNF